MKAKYVKGHRRNICWVMLALEECKMTQLYNRAIRAKIDEIKPKWADNRRLQGQIQTV